MSDLISRSALSKAMENKYDVAEKKGLYAVGLDCEFIITEQIINEQPIVEAVPVVHGEWIEDTVSVENPFDPYREDVMYVLMCSNCKTYYDVSERSNFCPNCGADMRKSEN